ncbi:unnamed protein product [Penicillium salamii]|uniref:Uncharacterized protein n=1 Tax=Penicillium salamii TaxID=1612424 RepID=A0A9W4JGM9_9EURO|nr:unnamed protein product [Penicillium salamii]CAG8245445.1 unnamed protein product [Penicillium salamii]CAG8398961.1 unnamed protein product [Penicillium salamii]
MPSSTLIASEISHPESSGVPLVESDSDDQESVYYKRKVASKWSLFSSVFLWEILAMILASGLLLAIILILAKYNHQPQPDWRYVSLNSVISWLSTIAKACLLFCITEGIGQLKWTWFTRSDQPISHFRIFDSASRGLFGSLDLIWSLKARHFAVLGSLAVILALAFDPFTQNLIRYYPKLGHDMLETAVLSKAFTYNSYGAPSNSFYFADPQLRANVYNSLFNSDSSRPWSIPPFTCSSGNCTWEDPITTLAMTSRCENITDKLQSHCEPLPPSGTNVRLPTDPTFSNCSIYLSSESAHTPENITVDFISDTIMGKPIVMGAIGTLASKDSLLHPIQIIAPDWLIAKSLYSGHFSLDQQWQAFECSLIPVVRSFRANVTNGAYHEETLGVWEEIPNYDEGDSSLKIDPQWGPEMGIQDEQVFVLDPIATMAMDSFIGDLFNAKMETSAKGYFFNSEHIPYAGSDVMQSIALYDFPGCDLQSAEKLRCAMENVAEAISKSFRDAAFSSKDKANSSVIGKAMTSMTYVEIRWQWIVLPVVVWLLALTTLVGTMWKTNKSKSPTWKNNLLPLLFLYENDHHEKAEDFESLSDLQRARLCDTDGGMRLSK